MGYNYHSHALVSQFLHNIQNLTNLIELLEAEGLRDKFVVCCGGPRITHELAKELGLPENEEVLMILDLGYAAEGAGPLANHGSRKPLSATVAYL